MTAAPDAVPEAASGCILVIDDQASNRTLLHDLLELDGHEVLLANDGATGLAMALERDPDVVLLDVTMPGLDGFEVCRRLRADLRTRATPVLLVTALGDREHRLRGVTAGANDYLVKPIDRSEVSVRVRNAVRLRRMHRTVENQFRALQRLERLRDDLVAMVAHDLRSPLAGVRGFIELLRGELQSVLTPELDEYLVEAIRSVDYLNGMVGDMLDVSRLEAEVMPLAREPADLLEIGRKAVDALGPQPSFHRVPIAATGAAGTVSCDPALIHRVVVNLLNNAVRFSPAGSPVTLEVRSDHGGHRLGVCDRGPGIAEAEQATIFEKFRQAGAPLAERGRGSGLGLTFCRMVIEAHQGRIGVTSQLGHGSEFWIWLPAD